MKVKKQDLTEEEKFELALQAEQEVARLSRKYTILERNRAQFADAGGKLAKQRKVLDIFKKERKNLRIELGVATSKGKKRADVLQSQQLKSLLNEYDTFDHEIKEQKTHLDEIDGQIKIVKKQVLELGAKQITDSKYHQRVVKGEKTVQTLENKLEVQIRKFCTINYENTKLRQEINHLLNERFEFNKIWDKLIYNLCVGKKFMLDLIEQATIAYDQREEWVSKLQSLRNKAHSDLLAHVQEMRELQRKRDNDIKLQEFFAIKGQKRIMRDLEEKELQKRQSNKLEMEIKLEKYLQIMIAIKEFTGQDLIEDIAKNFLNQEEENFAMFKYINHLNKQLEEVNDTLAVLQIEIDEQNALHEVRRVQQEHKLELLNSRFNEAQKQANEKEGELRTVENTLDVIMKGVEKLFELFRCKNDPLLLLLGENRTINYYNVLLYLEILEKNIQKALICVYRKEKALVEKKKLKPDQATIREQEKVPPVIEPIERIVTSNPCPLCVEHEMVSDVIDVLQFAYDKNKIQDKLEKRLQIEGAEERLHNVSACHLPKSRQIIQKRYQ